jgi:transposase
MGKGKDRGVFHYPVNGIDRRQAVKAVGRGETVASVAATFGVNIRTVFRGLSDFASGGQNALLAKSIPGRPPRR